MKKKYLSLVRHYFQAITLSLFEIRFNQKVYAELKSDQILKMTQSEFDLFSSGLLNIKGGDASLA